jgi:hypothetical protein
MLDLSILSVILQSWPEYLRLEDLANAEIDKGSGSYQHIFDSGVWIVEDRLELRDKALFDRLKQIYQRTCNRGNPEDAQIALAFPALCRVRGKGKDQRLKYHPLFTLDISFILKGNYRSAGWSLLDCDFYPIAANLIEFCKLGEPEIDSLVVSEGISRFLKDAFKKSFSTLSDFLNQIDLPTGCKSSRTAYIVQASFAAAYNTRLKEDLRLVNQQLLELGGSCAWLRDGHPANVYLHGKSQAPRHEVMFWAAFPGKIPDEFQAQAIKHAQENPLTPVSGGPGSGKTELLLHLLTQPIYGRAQALVHGESDCSSLCVFASTSNSAIEKFQHRLNSHFPSHLFYLPSGNRHNIINQTLPKLRAAFDWLQTQVFDADRYAQLKQNFTQAEAELQQKLENEPELQRQRSADIALLAQIDADLEGLQAIVEPANSTESQSNSDFSGFPVEAYRQIKTALEQAQVELPGEGDSLVKRFSDYLFVNNIKTVFSRLERRVRPAWMHAQGTAFPFQLPINPEQLQIAIAEVTDQLKQFEQWQAIQSVQEQRQIAIAKTQRQIAALESSQQQVQARLAAYPTEDFYTRFYQENHQLQVRIFEYAWEILQQEAIRRKSDVQTVLRTYEQILLGNEQAILELKLDPHTLYRDLSLVFPVLSSSLQSLANLFPVLEVDMIRLALMDEAGATLVHQPFPLLVRSQQAVIVGDPQQLRPITNLCADTVEAYWKSAFQAQNLDRTIYYRYAPTALNTATAYHRAAGADGEGDIGRGILLANHYRSVPVIVAFCSPNYPGGLITKTQPRPSLLGANLVAYHVAGRQEHQTNPDEIDAVIAVVKILLKHGYKLGTSLDSNSKTIGVISPFFHQAIALRHRLQAQWRDFPWSDVCTVHQFQGGEKAAIVFSPSHCDRNHLSFLNHYSNLLNTAVSRAEELFILVGNLDELEAAGGETRRLVQHIRQFGEVRSLP